MKTLLMKDIPPRAALAVVALALLATVVSGHEKQDLSQEPVPAASATSATTTTIAAAPVAAGESVPDLDPAGLKRLRTDKAIADLFAAPRAPEAEPQAAPRRSAPPLPFQFVARIVDGGNTSVYVTLGEDNYSVKPGLVIAEKYRVEKVTDTAVTFTYLPMGTRQELSLN
jgi:hypothetical protein